MPYYSLPKIKAPQPQVPQRVQGNRQRFSETLQQRQGFIDQRKQELQTGYVLQQLLNNPPQVMPGLPPAMMPPVPNQSGLGMLPFGMQRGRLPGFAEGGDVDTGGETEEERQERERAAAAGLFAGAGYMGGLGAFAPPPALPGAPQFGPPVPTYAENVQALAQQRPELGQIAAGEAAASNYDANLAQLRDYLPGGEKGPQYGPAPGPGQTPSGLEDVQARGLRAELLGQPQLGPPVQTVPQDYTESPLQTALRVAQGPAQVYTGLNVDIPFLTENVLEPSQRYLTERLQERGPLGDVLNEAGLGGSALNAVNKYGGMLGGAIIPTGALDIGTNLIGARGLGEVVTGLPIDDALRASLARAGGLPGVRAGVMEGIRGGERGAFQLGRGDEADTVYRLLTRDVGLVDDPAGRLAEQVRAGALKAEEALVQGQRMAQGPGVRGLNEPPGLPGVREQARPPVQPENHPLVDYSKLENVPVLPPPTGRGTISIMNSGWVDPQGQVWHVKDDLEHSRSLVNGGNDLAPVTDSGWARINNTRSGTYEIAANDKATVDRAIDTLVANGGIKPADWVSVDIGTPGSGAVRGGDSYRGPLQDYLNGEGMRLRQPLGGPPAGLPPPLQRWSPDELGPVLPSRPGAPQSDFGDLPPRPMAPSAPQYNYPPDIDWQGAVARIQQQRAAEAAAVGNVRLPGLVADEANLSRFLGDRTNLINQMRNAVGGERVLRESRLPQNAGLLPERTGGGLPDVIPMGPRSQPDVSGGFNFPTDTQGNRLGAAGVAESNSERISRYMQEAQAKVEPAGALPIEPRADVPPPREPLPSERLAGNAPAGAPAVPPGGTPAGWKLPEPGLLKLNDPERFEVSQRWAANQTNPPASSLTPQEMSTRLYNAGLESIASNRRDGSFTPPQLKQLADRYNYADRQGIKLPGEEPPSGMPDAFDLARAGRTPQGQAAAGSVRGLSLDEAEEQAARLGVPFDREAVQRGTQLTKDEEWGRLQKATDDFIEKERLANDPAAKAASDDYKARLEQERLANDPAAAATPPPGGFPADVDTPALQRAYNIIMDAAYNNLAGDWGTVMRQDITSMFNLTNIPQSIQVIKDAARMASGHAEAVKVLDEFDAIIKVKNDIVGKKVNLHLPDIPGVREGKGFENRELLQSSLAGRIPGIGAYYNVTGRANAGLLYSRRVREYERFVDNLPERRMVMGWGPNANSKKAMGNVAQSYANMVAVMGGRGNLNFGPLKLEAALSKAGPLFTSLRFMMSVPERIPYLLPVNRIAAGHWELMGPQWREAVRQHAGFAGTLATTLAMASAAGLEIDKDKGSIKYHGLEFNLTGGLNKYWNTIQKMADGDYMAGAEFLRGRVGPLPGDIMQVLMAMPGNGVEAALGQALQTAGIGNAGNVNDFFSFMRPEYYDRGFTGTAKQGDPFWSASTANRILGAVAPLWMGQTARAYNAAQARGDNPFVAAAAIGGAEFFGVNTSSQSPGVLTQLRTNVQGDEALPPVLRDTDFKDMGPDAKAAVDKLAEASAPEEFKAAKKEQEERSDPAFTKHKETVTKIEAEQAQRKTDVYEMFRAGKIDGRDMSSLRTAINTSAAQKKDKASSDPAFKKALEDLPEKNEVNKALSAYYQIVPAFTKADGKIDWQKASTAQAEFLKAVHDKDAKVANLLAFELNTKDALNNPLDRFMAAAQPTLDKYYGQGTRDPLTNSDMRRANPGEDALLSLLGYGATKSPQGAQALIDLRAILPEGKAGAATAGVQRSSAPAPAPAPAPQPLAAPLPAAPLPPAAGLPAPTGARLPPVAPGEFKSATASPQQRENFIGAMRDPANAYSGATRIPPSVFMAMGASESNWGRAPSVFGIKGVGSAGGANLATHEVYGGQKVNINDQFAAYNNLDDAFKHFIDLTSHGRYQGAWNQLQDTGDWQGFLRGIVAAGYATDKSWPDSIISLSRHIENTYG